MTSWDLKKIGAFYVVPPRLLVHDVINYGVSICTFHGDVTLRRSKHKLYLQCSGTFASSLVSSDPNKRDLANSPDPDQAVQGIPKDPNFRFFPSYRISPVDLRVPWHFAPGMCPFEGYKNFSLWFYFFFFWIYLLNYVMLNRQYTFFLWASLVNRFLFW
jgi:hypothetical protein